MKFLIIVGNYPTKLRPYNGVFIQKTIKKLVQLNHDVTVIAPIKFSFGDNSILSENNLRLFQPRYLSLGNFNLFGFSTFKLTLISFFISVNFFLKREKNEYDIIYTHFFAPSGITGLRCNNPKRAKVVCTIGESNFYNYLDRFSDKYIQDKLKQFDLLVFNSEESRKNLIKKFNIDKLKTLVVPNGFDNDDLKGSCSKEECRKMLSIADEYNIVIFVGGFVERKGPLRVKDACELINDDNLKLIFLGSGPQVPIGSKVLFAGSVDPKLVLLYLKAADLFVLPTIEEGMSNAVVEAMGVGLPIITSRIQSNIELLGADYKYLCEPRDINQLKSMIEDILVNRENTVNYKVPMLDDRIMSIISAINF